MRPTNHISSPRPFGQFLFAPEIICHFCTMVLWRCVQQSVPPSLFLSFVKAESQQGAFDTPPGKVGTS
jgi:hypothetical protein